MDAIICEAFARVAKPRRVVRVQRKGDEKLQKWEKRIKASLQRNLEHGSFHYDKDKKVVSFALTNEFDHALQKECVNTDEIRFPYNEFSKRTWGESVPKCVEKREDEVCFRHWLTSFIPLLYNRQTPESHEIKRARVVEGMLDTVNRAQVEDGVEKTGTEWNKEFMSGYSGLPYCPVKITLDKWKELFQDARDRVKAVKDMEEERADREACLNTLIGRIGWFYTLYLKNHKWPIPTLGVSVSNSGPPSPPLKPPVITLTKAENKHSKADKVAEAANLLAERGEKLKNVFPPKSVKPESNSDPYPVEIDIIAEMEAYKKDSTIPNLVVLDGILQRVSPLTEYLERVRKLPVPSPLFPKIDTLTFPPLKAKMEIVYLMVELVAIDTIFSWELFGQWELNDSWLKKVRALEFDPYYKDAMSNLVGAIGERDGSAFGESYENMFLLVNCPIDQASIESRHVLVTTLIDILKQEVPSVKGESFNSNFMVILGQYDTAPGTDTFTNLDKKIVEYEKKYGYTKKLRAALQLTLATSLRYGVEIDSKCERCNNSLSRIYNLTDVYDKTGDYFYLYILSIVLVHELGKDADISGFIDKLILKPSDNTDYPLEFKQLRIKWETYMLYVKYPVFVDPNNVTKTGLEEWKKQVELIEDEKRGSGKSYKNLLLDIETRDSTSELEVRLFSRKEDYSDWSHKVGQQVLLRNADLASAEAKELLTNPNLDQKKLDSLIAKLASYLKKSAEYKGELSAKIGGMIDKLNADILARNRGV